MGDYSRYRDYFGCDVFFEQEANAFSFDAALLNRRGTALSSSLHPIIEDHLRRREPVATGDAAGFADRVRLAISTAPLDRPPQASDVAQRLGCSPATFNRRLVDEGTSWRALLAVLRMDAAARLLCESRREISAIALALGFSESAAFVRSFTRHFGISPGRYRRRMQNDAALLQEGDARAR